MALFSSWSEITARSSRYGRAVNSYDWLKFVALIIMTIDHVGAYVIVDSPEWYRAIGRITFPAWFFLAGYSQSRQLGGEIIWLGLALAIANYFAGFGIFPLNALFSIVICRYIVFALKDRGWIERYSSEIFVASLFLSLVTISFFEYGTLGVCFAVMGDMVRRGLHGRKCLTFTILSTLLYIAYQFLWFSFNSAQMAFVIIGTCYTVWILYRFKIKPCLWIADEGIVNVIVRFIARNTLHYYFIHRALLQLLGLWLGIRTFAPTLIFN